MSIIPTQNNYPDRAGYLGLDTDRNVLVGMSDGILQDMTNSTPDGWINVKDFGAKGDGVTDDTEAIQAAIDYCSNGGTIYFPIGIYITTASINIPYSFVSLIGASRGRTIIKKNVDTYDGLENLNTIISLGTETEIRRSNSIENLTLNGYRAYGTNPSESDMIGLYTKSNYDAYYSKITIQLVNTGIKIYDSVMSTYLNIRINYPQYGIISENLGGTSNSFINCFVNGDVYKRLSTAYKLKSMHYSNMISCATDHGIGHPYHFYGSTITMNSCACEDWTLPDTLKGLIQMGLGSYVINNFETHHINNNYTYGSIFYGEPTAYCIINMPRIFTSDPQFPYTFITESPHPQFLFGNIFTPENVGAKHENSKIFVNNLIVSQASLYDNKEYYLNLKSVNKNWKLKIDDTGSITSEEIL